MKRLIVLAVLCAFVLSAAAASASELKASGYFMGDASWMNNWDFKKDTGLTPARNFDIKQRTELVLEFITSENLKSVLEFRANQTWGRDNSAVDGGPTDALQIRQAYVAFNWPGSDVAVSVGFQGVALPNAVAGSLILDSRAGALVVSKPLTDNVALTGAYIRAISSADALGQLDAYALIADITAGDVNVKPFVVIANTGANTTAAGYMQTANGTADVVDSAYWLGASATATVGGVALAGDINYGNVSGDNSYGDRSGYAVLLSADYAMDMMTPEAFFVYTSGEDDNDTNGSERMPQINGDYSIGSFFFGGESWRNSVATSGDYPLGFWAIGLSLKDIASINENMYHVVHVIYGKGTNDKATGLVSDANYGSVMTEKDHVVEVDFNTYYKVYDQLTIGLELGYANLSCDEDVWGAGKDGGSAYKVSTGLKYSF